MTSRIITDDRASSTNLLGFDYTDTNGRRINRRGRSDAFGVMRRRRVICGLVLTLS